MDMEHSGSILEIRPGAREAVRRAVNLHRPGDMEEAVRILDEWIHQQPHYLYKEIPKLYLESTILTNKGSIEKSKMTIDKLCTLRTLMPDQFRPHEDDDNIRQKAIKDGGYICIFPKQTEDFYRILTIKPHSLTKDIQNLFYKCCYLLVDYGRMYDCHMGVDIFFDLTGLDLKEALTHINYMDLKDAAEIVHQSYSLRVRRYVSITSSKWIEPLLNIIKPLMRKKIADRIVVLNDYSSLHQFYPKDILPKEYGGTERSLDELQDILLHDLSSERHTRFREKLFEARTDESKRAPDVFNDLYAGTTGTFRTLTLD